MHHNRCGPNDLLLNETDVARCHSFLVESYRNRQGKPEASLIASGNGQSAFVLAVIWGGKEAVRRYKASVNFTDPQWDEYLLRADRVLDDLTRTPMIVAEVVSLFQAGKTPTSRLGVLGAATQMMENSETHQIALANAPLSGLGRAFLESSGVLWWRAVAFNSTKQRLAKRLVRVRVAYKILDGWVRCPIPVAF